MRSFTLLPFISEKQDHVIDMLLLLPATFPCPGVIKSLHKYKLYIIYFTNEVSVKPRRPGYPSFQQSRLTLESRYQSWWL